MNFQDPQRWELLARELAAISPELWLIAGMCGVLLAPFFKRQPRLPAMVAMVCMIAGLIFAVGTLLRDGGTPGPILGGMFVIDAFSQFFKIMVLALGLLVMVQWLLLSQEETARRDVPDYLCLLLGAMAGMLMMASASNLLMIFIAIETASLPSYVLAGFRRHGRLASEASLKYVIFGAAASAIMLYGMSLIYGMTGQLNLAGVASAIAQDGITPLLAVGMLAGLAGLAFKLSAVPMHFWSPDVFQAAPPEVATLLSIASKGAAVCLTVRILTTLGMAGMAEQITYGVMIVIALLGAVTATWGNLLALRQHHIRRLLAYSSIAHAGYMLMAASVLVVMPMDDALGRRETVGALLFYLMVYLLMNLGAFTAAGIIALHEKTHDIRRYAGLVHRQPWLAIVMLVFLLSLFGMPGLGGFMAKLLIASQMFELGSTGFVLVAVLLGNTLISLYFYLRPAYYMLIAPPATHGVQPYPLRTAAMALTGACAVLLIWTGILPASASRLAQDFGTIKSSAFSASSSAQVLEQMPEASEQSNSRAEKAAIHD